MLRGVYIIFSLCSIVLQSCKEESLVGKDFHTMALAGRIDLVERLLDSGTDVNEKDYIGATAIFYSSGAFHYELTSYLIERGTDLSVVNSAGETPIHRLVAYPIPVRLKDKAIKIIKLLMNHGVDIELRTENNLTAAECAYEATRLGEGLNICNKEIGDFLAKHKDEPALRNK